MACRANSGRTRVGMIAVTSGGSGTGAAIAHTVNHLRAAAHIGAPVVCSTFYGMHRSTASSDLEPRDIRPLLQRKRALWPSLWSYCVKVCGSLARPRFGVAQPRG